MSTTQSTIDFLADQLSHQAKVTYRKMFGEYALYSQGKVVSLVCDDELFVKPTVAGRQLIGEPVEKPPYQGAKPYFWISGDYWDDAEWLNQLIVVTARELPLPKKPRLAR